MLKNEPKEMIIKRIIMAIFGVALSGFVVGTYQKIVFGVDPFTCFVTAFANIFHSSYSTVYPIVTGILLVFAFFVSRNYIGISTILNLTCSGFTADFMYGIWDRLFPEPGMAVRIALLVLAVVVGSFAASLYYTADLGVSGYDAVALTAANKFHLAAFRVCRITTDLICVIVGFIFHVTIGIGTVITALCMGPIIQWFNTHFSEPLLYGKKK